MNIVPPAMCFLMEAGFRPVHTEDVFHFPIIGSVAFLMTTSL